MHIHIYNPHIPNSLYVSRQFRTQYQHKFFIINYLHRIHQTRNQPGTASVNRVSVRVMGQRRPSDQPILGEPSFQSSGFALGVP